MSKATGDLYSRLNRATVSTTSTITKTGAVVSTETLKTTGAEMTGNLIMDTASIVLKSGSFLQVNDANDTKSVQLTGPAGALASDYKLVLPGTVPLANQIIQVDTVVGDTATTKYSTVVLPDQAVGTGDSPTFAGLSLTAPLSVTNGGTGSNLTIALTPQMIVTDGGKLVQSGAVFSADGQIPVYSGTNNPFFRPLKLVGTANQVSVTQDLLNGELELAAPQDLGTGSSVTFAKVTTPAVEAAAALSLASTGLLSSLTLGTDATLLSATANRVLVGHSSHSDGKRNLNVLANGNVDVRGSLNGSITTTVSGSGKHYEHRVKSLVVEYNTVTPITLDAAEVADGLYIRGVANLDLTLPTGADLEAAFKSRHGFDVGQSLPTGTVIELCVVSDAATTHKLTTAAGLTFVNKASPYTSATGEFSRIYLVRTAADSFDVAF